MKKLWSVLCTILSVLVCIALAGSLLCSSLISKQRVYLSSGQFREQVESMKPGEIKFIKDGSKVTLQDYLSDYVEAYLREYIPNSSYFSGYAVEALLSSDTVRNATKEQLYDIVDYFLYADVKEAKDRIEKGITISENPRFNPENANNINEAVDIAIKAVVLQYIEDATGITTDEIIVIISEDTLNSFQTAFFLLSMTLILLFGAAVRYRILCLGSGVLLYCAGIKYIEYKFITATAGNEDLVSYVFVKPYIDRLTENITRDLILGLVLVIIFVVLQFIIKKKKSI